MNTEQSKTIQTSTPHIQSSVGQMDTFYYDNKIVKWFAYASIFWGIVGMLAGIYAALELSFPQLSFGLSATSFGRVRPVHTNAVIFAFVGNGIFMGVY